MKRWLSHIIVFIVGIIFGIALCMALAFYNIHREMGKALIGPRIFEDIRIVPVISLAPEKKILSLLKDNLCFMMITQDSNGITKFVSTTVNENENDNELGFMMQPLQSPGKWECCYGSLMIKGKPTSELYWDFNFDGQFDTRYVFDANGKKKTSWIFVNGDWHKVIGAGHRYAKDDSTTFRFDPDSGWLQNDVNLITDNLATDPNKNNTEKGS